MLAEIGAIGRVQDRSSSQEVLGAFDYTQPSQLRLREADEICIHPVFALQYNSPDGKQGARTSTVVIPVGSDLRGFIS